MSKMEQEAKKKKETEIKFYLKGKTETIFQYMKKAID